MIIASRAKIYKEESLRYQEGFSINRKDLLLIHQGLSALQRLSALQIIYHEEILRNFCIAFDIGTGVKY